MAGSRSYRDLAVWRKSMDLAESVYHCTRSFPGEKMYGIVSQMRRAVASIPSNIAEGQAGNSLGEFRQFLGIAAGSVADLETWILLCVRIGYLDLVNAFGELRGNRETPHRVKKIAQTRGFNQTKN